MRDKEYLIAILAEGGIMRAETLRFADEVRSPEDVGLPEPVKVKPAARKKFEASIRKLSEKQFDPSTLVDRTTERLLELIEQKRASGEDVVEAEDSEEPPDDIIDLMEVLKRSLSGKESAPHRSSARKAGKTRAKTAAKTAAKTPAGKKGGATAARKAAAKKKATRRKAS
jgi:DNA end-binding protein Ku